MVKRHQKGAGFRVPFVLSVALSGDGKTLASGSC